MYSRYGEFPTRDAGGIIAEYVFGHEIERRGGSKLALRPVRAVGYIKSVGGEGKGAA